MPLPTPNQGETEQEFVSRCMANETVQADFDGQEQRAAVCYRQWREREGKAMSNALKAIKRTEDELRVGNYIVLFGGRDLEGLGSSSVNADGSKGEYFTPETQLDSFYTKRGAFPVDWEHSQGELGDVLLGVVDWKTAQIDERGVFVERVLDRHSQYVRWIEELIDLGVIGTSSEADPAGVKKAKDGAILSWPLRRDTLTVQPMEPRMITENHLQAFKALGIDLAPDDTEATEQEQETAPEADSSAVAVARAKARLQVHILSLEGK